MGRGMTTKYFPRHGLVFSVLCRTCWTICLSIHVRSRVFATLEDAAQFIKSVSMLYDAYVETKNIKDLKVNCCATCLKMACEP